MEYGIQDEEFNRRIDRMDYEEKIYGHFGVKISDIHNKRILNDKEFQKIYNEIKGKGAIRDSFDFGRAQEKHTEYENACKEHPLKEGEIYTEVIPLKDGTGRWDNKDLMIAQTENGPMLRITEGVGNRRSYIGNLSFTNENGEKQTMFVQLSQSIYEQDHEDMGLYTGFSWAFINDNYIEIKTYGETLFNHLDTKFKQAVGELKNTNEELYNGIYHPVSQPVSKL